MKNHPTPSLAAALALALGLSSCIITIDDAGASWHGFHSSSYGPSHKGSGVTAEDERALPAVHSVELEGSLDIDVTVTPGAEQQILVVGDDNLLAHVRTEVDHGVLRVDLDSGSYRMKQSLRVVATLPELRSIQLDGSGDIQARGLDNEDFRVSLRGSGDIKVTGRTHDLEAGLYGSGDVDLAGLQATDVKVELQGSGDVRVSAQEQLDIVLDGSGDIGYRGNPRVQLKMSGSGDVYSFD